MHELSIVASMVDTVEKIMEEQKLTVVDTIVLQIGELSGIVPEFVEQCFPMATYRSPLKDAKLKLEMVPGNGKCQLCKGVYHVGDNRGVCPFCGSVYYDVVSGSEFVIKELLAY